MRREAVGAPPPRGEPERCSRSPCRSGVDVWQGAQGVRRAELQRFAGRVEGDSPAEESAHPIAGGQVIGAGWPPAAHRTLPPNDSAGPVAPSAQAVLAGGMPPCSTGIRLVN